MQCKGAILVNTFTAKLKELQEECVDQKVHFEDQLKKLQEERQKTEDMVETELEIFVVYKRENILQAMKRHGGKRVSLEVRMVSLTIHVL